MMRPEAHDLSKKTWIAVILLAVTWSGPSWAAPSFAAVAPGRSTAPASEVLNYDRFGQVQLYRARGRPRDVVILLSGADGWDRRAAAIAAHLAERGDVVAGIDLRVYAAQLERVGEACVSPAADVENLSHYLQSKLALKRYAPPTLVGDAAGAAWAYAMLAEAPDGLFDGALGIGFDPAVDLKKPLCAGPGFDVTPRLAADGAVVGQTVSGDEALVPGQWLSLASLPVEGGWQAFDAALARVAAPRAEPKVTALPVALADLPLVIVGARTGAPGAWSDWFAVFLSGDGGWVGLDKGVSQELARQGIPVVGWDSLKYFWTRRAPDGASHDLDRVMNHYTRAWKRSHVLLIGYSQGADTLPFMINRLPNRTHAMVGFTTLLGISDNALWEFHVATWLGHPAKGVPTAPELQRWSGAPYLCLYGGKRCGRGLCPVDRP